ncbi:hypothetical protein B0T17DRAFT_539194 [Bombardia bombarda]|uniref:Uncharacterized protein n=1 Tax=Bombardia bombarda TaxID=252184 RepID=A0AA39WI23_9PEZI|nr:hypothetical protein B0T17DRAFT_539194 [Bombardia bombarda]
MVNRTPPIFILGAPPRTIPRVWCPWLELLSAITSTCYFISPCCCCCAASLLVKYKPLHLHGTHITYLGTPEALFFLFLFLYHVRRRIGAPFACFSKHTRTPEGRYMLTILLNCNGDIKFVQNRHSSKQEVELCLRDIFLVEVRATWLGCELSCGCERGSEREGERRCMRVCLSLCVRLSFSPPALGPSGLIQIKGARPSPLSSPLSSPRSRTKHKALRSKLPYISIWHEAHNQPQVPGGSLE